jgi:hypothetical protein
VSEQTQVSVQIHLHLHTKKLRQQASMPLLVSEPPQQV